MAAASAHKSSMKPNILFSKSNEPYIPVSLPSTDSAQPKRKYILTPVRHSDSTGHIRSLNDPRVYQYLVGPPFPYTEKDWEWWYAIVSEKTEKALGELRSLMTEGETERNEGVAEEGAKRVTYVSEYPFTAVREVDEETGEERLVGDVGVHRKGTFGGGSKKDEEVWTVGFFLNPDYHGRGLMTAAFKTALNEFLIPYMGIRHMQSGYLEGNFASRRVLEKCGFVFSKLIPEAIEVQESKCGVKGKKVALGHMQWDLS